MTNTSPVAPRTHRVRREEAGGQRPDGQHQNQIRVRRDPSTIHLQPTDDPLTGVAGLVLFGSYLRKLGVDKALHATFDHLKSGVRMVYQVGDVMRLIMDALVVGEQRIFPIEALAGDPLFVLLAGGMVPSVDVLYDDLRRFGDADIEALLDLMRVHGLAALRGRTFKILHIDIDSTVEPLFGEEIEGANKGYNPRYRGRVSYHPLLARIAEVNTVVGARLRPGDTSFGVDDVPWLKEVIGNVRKAVGPDTVLIVRIDTAGDAVEVLDAIDKLGCLFVIKAKMGPELCEQVALLPDRAWSTVDRDADQRPVRQVIAVPDFTRKCWAERKVLYDVIAVRERDKVGGRKLYLWADTDWTAHAYVTNMFDWDESDIAEEYAQRAGIEPLIGELKYGYGIGKVPTGDFQANHVMFLLKLLTYNLVQRYVRAQHPTLVKWQIEWLRRVLFRVPGRLVRHARKLVLLVSRTSRLVTMLN